MRDASQYRPVAPSALAPRPADRSAVANAHGLPLLPPPVALFELAVAFALIFGLDWLNPQLGVLDMEPHPFWIPVLLLGLQYGTVSGLVAAGAAIAATMALGVPEAGIGENHFAYFLRVWGQPILWIAMALLVGQFRMRQIAAKRDLMRVGESLARQRDEIARHADSLHARCELLERELAGRRHDTPHRALSLLAQLQHGAEAAGHSGTVLAALMSAAFPGARARLYRLVDGAMVEQSDEPAQANASLAVARSIPRGHPLIVALSNGRRSLSVLDASAERLLDGIGLAAAPVVGDDEAPITGMVVLEEVDASALGDDGIAALTAIAGGLAGRPRPPLPAVAASARLQPPGSIASAGRQGLRLLMIGETADAPAPTAASRSGDAAVER